MRNKKVLGDRNSDNNKNRNNNNNNNNNKNNNNNNVVAIEDKFPGPTNYLNLYDLKTLWRRLGGHVPTRDYAADFTTSVAMSLRWAEIVPLLQIIYWWMYQWQTWTSASISWSCDKNSLD